MKNSFRQLLPLSEQVAALFYARLFEIDPSLRALFHGDMQEQGRKLMSLLGGAVASAGNVQALTPTLRELGVKHANYGVNARHFVAFGTALMWTLEKTLGATFTAEVRAAWNAFYTALAHTLRQAEEGAT